ncbi:universal stress protein [Singulisphaera sp. Ch08]|uniref:Universal stress protein n=1 Tax=Singulisphaera sp. Ch08 TaxID=3120278 RepID=A0AAU7CD58_9BACT
MLPFRTILVAADFSQSSREAFRVACCLALREEARLLVLYVVEPLHVAPEPVYFGQQSISFSPVGRPSEFYAVLKKSLKHFYALNDSIKIEFLTRDGEPAKEILRLSEEVRCDLIVMGTHGRTGLDRVLTGSIAEKVVRMAGCPVLTQRFHRFTATAGAQSPGRSSLVDEIGIGIGGDLISNAEVENEPAPTPIRCILHPTDFSAGARVAFAVARSLASQQHARLVLLHVIPNESASIEVPPQLVDRQPFQVALETMRSSVVGPDPKSTVETALRDGAPVSEILRMASEVQCDLIVMGTHGRSGLERLFMGSVAEQVLRLSTSPVLTVKSAHAVADYQNDHMKSAHTGMDS